MEQPSSQKQRVNAGYILERRALQGYIDKIPLGGMGIEANVPLIDELGEKELIVR